MNCWLELARVEEHLLRDQADDFHAGDLEPAGGRGAADLLVGDVQRDGVDVGDVHRHLRDAVFVNIPADGLATLQGAGNPDLLALLVLQQFAGEGYFCIFDFFCFWRAGGR